MVSAINSTITVTLSTALTTTPTAADFAVTQAIDGGGASNVTPSVVALDPTGKIVTLTVPAVAAKATADQSVVDSVSYKNGAAVVASPFVVKSSVDVTAPTVSSVQSVNGNQLLVTFSEPVDSTNAAVAENFTVYNTVTGKSNNLVTGTDITGLSADGTTLTITLSAGVTDNVGITGLNTLDAVAYRLFVNVPTASAATLVSDIAGNKVPANTFVNFTGTIGADTTAPILITAQLKSGTKVVELNFNEKAYAADVSKLTLTDGTTSLVLKAGVDTADVTTKAGAQTKITYTINDAANQVALASLTGNVRIQLAAGAIKDTSDNSIADTALVATSVLNPAVLATGTAYDENTHKLTIKFNKAVKISSLINLSKITVGNIGQALTSTTITGNMTLDNASDSDTLIFTLNPTAQAEIQNATSRNDTNKVKYFVSVAADAVTDTAGNNLGAANNNVALSYNRDDVKPVISGVTYNSATKTLDVTFDESTNKTLDSTKIQVWTKDASGTLVQLGGDSDLSTGIDTALTAAPVSWTAKDATTAPNGAGVNTARFVLTDAENADMITAAPNGRFIKIVTAHGLTDVNGNPLVDDSVAPITYIDNTSATASTPVVVTLNKISVTYSKALDAAAAQNVANAYVYLAATPANKIVPTKATLQSDNKTVVYEFSDSFVSGVTYTFAHQNLKDSLGFDVTSETNKTFTATAAQPDIVSATFTDNGDSVKSAGDKITVTFNAPIQVKAGQTITAADFGLADDNHWYNTTGAVNGFGTGASFAVSGNTLVITLGASPSATEGLFTSNTNAGAPVIDASMAVLNKLVGEDGTTAIQVSDANKARVAAPDANGPKITSAIFTDVNNDGIVDAKDTLQLTFDKTITDGTTPGTKITDLTDNNFIISTDGSTDNATFALGSATFAKAGTNQIVVTLADDTNYNSSATTKWFDATGKIQLIGSADVANLTNVWGISARGAASTSAAAEIAVAPSIANADTTGAKITAAQFVDANLSSTASTGDEVILTFDKPVNAGIVDASTFTGLGTVGSVATSAANLSPTKVLLTYTNATGAGFTNSININALKPSNDIRTINGLSAITTGGAAETVINVEAGVSATKLNGVIITKDSSTTPGSISIDTDALMIGSKVLVFNSSTGNQVTSAKLTSNGVVVDNGSGKGVLAGAVDDITFADGAGLSTVIYITKDGVVHAVNFALNLHS